MEAKAFDDVEELVGVLESLYSNFHDKASCLLEVLQSTPQKLRCGRKQSTGHVAGQCPIDLYQRILEAGASRVCRVERQPFVFSNLRGRMQQFLEKFKELRKRVKVVDKEIVWFRQSEDCLRESLAEYNSPVTFYDQVENSKIKKVLAEKFTDHLARKKVLHSDLHDRNKLLESINQLYDWLDKEVQEGLGKCIQAFGSTGDGLVPIVRQFLQASVDCMTQEMENLSKEPAISHQISLDFSVRDSQNLQEMHEKSVKACKLMIKNELEDVKQNDLAVNELKATIGKLYKLRRHVEKEISHLEFFKIRLSSLSSSALLFGSYKVTLDRLIVFYDLCISSFQRIFEEAACCQQLNLQRTHAVEDLKREIAKTELEEGHNLEQTKFCLVKAVTKTQEINRKNTQKMKDVLIDVTKSFHDDIKKIELQLAQSSRDDTADSHLLITKFRLSRDRFDFRIPNDESLQKSISSFIKDTPFGIFCGKENGSKVYSCALSQKILLAGKMKLSPEGLFFESVFNRKNVFFGTTQLFIPKSHISGVTKETMLLVPNSLSVETIKGPLLFTSLFNRDKTFAKILLALKLDNKEQVKSATDQTPRLRELRPVMAEMRPITQQELATINNKSSQYPVTLTQSLSIPLFQIKLANTTLPEVYNELYNEQNPISRNNNNYSCFKNYILLNCNNDNILLQPMTPPPPSFYHSTSPTSLSHLLSSTKISTYRHEVGSVPIPFMPKYGNCTQTETFHWVSNRSLVIDSETNTRGIPCSDSFVVLHKTVIEEKEDCVEINESAEISFVKKLALERIVKSSAEKELKKTGIFTKEAIQWVIGRYIKEKSSVAPVSGEKADSIHRTEAKTQTSLESNKTIESDVDSCHGQLMRFRAQHRRNILLLCSLFLLILLLSRLV